MQELGAKSIYSQHSGVVEVSSKLFPVIDVSTGGYPCSLLPRCLLPCFCQESHAALFGIWAGADLHCCSSCMQSRWGCPCSQL